MGLYIKFSAKDLGYPKKVPSVITDKNGKSKVIMVSVDYTRAFEAFPKIFELEAKRIVPVDTGYLRSTIKAGIEGKAYDDMFCWAEATAEYAQYVEYGTWKMRAQPYFHPALNKALKQFHILAIQAINEAQLSGQMTSSNKNKRGNNKSGGSAIGGAPSLKVLGLMTGIFVVLFPLLANLYGIVHLLDYEGTNNGSSFSTNSPNITIT